MAKLGAPQPLFGHVPIILGDDGHKLSKRRGAVSVYLDGRAGRVLSLVSRVLGPLKLKWALRKTR